MSKVFAVYYEGGAYDEQFEGVDTLWSTQQKADTEVERLEALQAAERAKETEPSMIQFFDTYRRCHYSVLPMEIDPKSEEGEDGQL